tara:strand:- start:392 stop:937 length:546 start_codon:yes stop_codon:yes gene_type:complete
MIHNSHSRKDLLELSDIFNVRIEDKYDLSKKELANSFWDSLQTMRTLEPDEQYYFIESKDELLEYLENPHQTKSLTIQDKQEIIKFSRYIIYYCDHGFNLDPHFQDIQELKQIAEYISNYGDIATCRRALKLLSFDKKINPSITPIISKRVQKELEEKKKLKKDTMNSLRINKAKVIVVFD